MDTQTTPNIEDVTRREFIAGAFATAFAAACGDSDTDAPAATGTGFPVTIQHKYGETVIPSRPQRIATVAVTDHDYLLALGITPVGIRDWYGNKPYGVWPWAQPALGNGKPTVYTGQLDFEQIATLKPDLIVGVRSGVTEDEYRLLSRIAPTVVQPKEFAGGATPWQDILKVISRAVGEEAEGAEIQRDIEARFAAMRREHPDWQGKTAVFVNPEPGKPHAYSSGDNRARLLMDLGFVIPPAVERLPAPGTYFAYLSLEDFSPIDTDVVVWYAYQDDIAPIQALELRRFMRAYREGREVIADDLMSGAWSFASPLSLDYFLDNIARELDAAIVGNPATRVPSAVKYGLVQ